MHNDYLSLDNSGNQCNSVNKTAALFALATTTTPAPTTARGQTTTTSTTTSNVSAALLALTSQQHPLTTLPQIIN
jgi:hypothetical protein